MTYYNEERLWFLIVNTVDNLEQIDRARELTNIISDVNFKSKNTERDWKKIAVLLESYEQARDESLEAALLNLRELVLAMSRLT